MSISLNNISKRYDKQLALNDISIQVSKGEIVGLLGPNGAGKSTLMKILTGYIPQSAGTASVAGNDINEKELQVKALVGYLPENNPLYTDMYVREYLSFVAGTYKVKKGRVNDLIEQTGLTPEKHKRISQLSKGYRQRVGLAAALIHDPDVLILDEPTTGLDPNQLVEIRNLIKEVGKEKTVLLSTHIMQEVEQLCDRVVIINKGELVADKPIDELKHLSNTITISVTFGKAVSINQLKKVSGVQRVRSMNDLRFEIETNEPEKTKESLFQFAIDQKVTISEIKDQDQNLEQIFRKFTK